MKPSPTRSPSGGSQYSSDTTLEGFQGGIEYRIEDLDAGPVVVGRDDQMPARLQDTEDLSQGLRQRYRATRTRQSARRDQTSHRQMAHCRCGPPAQTRASPGRLRRVIACRPFDHFLKVVDGPYPDALPRDCRRDDTRTTSDLQNRRARGQADAIYTGERPAGAFLIDPAIDGSVGVDLFPVRKRGTKMLLDERVVRQAMAGCPGVATCAIEAHTSRRCMLMANAGRLRRDTQPPCAALVWHIATGSQDSRFVVTNFGEEP